MWYILYIDAVHANCGVLGCNAMCLFEYKDDVVGGGAIYLQFLTSRHDLFAFSAH